ncbi:MAG: sugar transporter [Lautropia sp.]|nr:sugar transporter [Lautropia sp.]
MSKTPTPTSAPGSWAAVIALALAAFIFNTTEFVPVGLLSMIGQDFGMRTEDVGLMLTIYAWVVALGSLPLMLATRATERKRLLAVLFVIFSASHAISATATSFWLLMLSRLGVASAHAIFWSITPSLAVRLAPPNRASQALGLLATGSSLAMVLGIPLGRVIGEALGWRMTFGLIGISAMVIMIVLMSLLPRLASQNSGSLSSLPLLIRRPALASVYLLVVLGVTAHFTAYSYLEPFAQHEAGLQGQAITLILLVFGGSGLIGSVLFGWLGNRNPGIFLPGSLLGISLCLLGLHTAATSLGWLLTLLVIWGTMVMCFSLCLQARVLVLAADATDVAMALFSGLFNLAIGAGALQGNQVSIHWGLDHLGQVAGALASITLLISLLALGRFRTEFLRIQTGTSQVGSH